MDEVLLRALEPVLRDLVTTGGPSPRLEPGDWSMDDDHPCAMMWSADRTGQGVAVDRLMGLSDQIASVADQVQEWVIEDLWGQRPTNWPRCPHHPDTHPVRPSVREATAIWVCPANDSSVAPIGALGAS